MLKIFLSLLMAFSVHAGVKIPSTEGLSQQTARFVDHYLVRTEGPFAPAYVYLRYFNQHELQALSLWLVDWTEALVLEAKEIIAADKTPVEVISMPELSTAHSTRAYRSPGESIEIYVELEHKKLRSLSEVEKDLYFISDFVKSLSHENAWTDQQKRKVLMYMSGFTSVAGASLAGLHYFPGNVKLGLVAAVALALDIGFISNILEYRSKEDIRRPEQVQGYFRAELKRRFQAMSLPVVCEKALLLSK